MSLDPKALGDQIRSAREALGYNQHEFAERVGVTNRTVGEWERGRRPPQKRIGLIEQVLGITLRGYDTHADLSEFSDAALASELTSRIAAERDRVAELEERLRAVGIDPDADNGEGEGP